MTDTDFDIVIIGGGIHGCGVAQAAASSGYRTALLEKNVIASGTSSQSTKLVHGGLRYLEQGNFKLVYEALRERETLLKLAPHLVEKVWFYIPVYKHSKRSAWQIHLGLWFYALLSKGKSRYKKIPRSDWSSSLPALNTTGLSALFAYEDAATDDAKLTRAVANSAQDSGCAIREHIALQYAEFKRDHWQLSLSNGEQIRCRLLVNAAGPWVNQVAQYIQPPQPRLNIQLVQGTHLVLNRVCHQFIYVESNDGRVMFFRPWQGKVLVGTTETPHPGRPEDAHPTKSEITDILNTYNLYFPQSACKETDIINTYCGLRVLPLQKQNTTMAFTANRETSHVWDNLQHPHYVALYGGKMTTYRRTAEKLIKQLQQSFPAPHPTDTAQIPLP